MSTEIDWDTYSTLARSSVRREVSEALQTGAKTPSEIEEETEVLWAHVSRALSELREAGIAELCVPESTAKGRVHDLTPDGRDALALLQERDA